MGGGSGEGAGMAPAREPLLVSLGWPVPHWRYWADQSLTGLTSTLLVHWRTVLMSSWITKSTHFRHGSFSFTTCFFTMASNARSGVNSPVLEPTEREKRDQSGIGTGGRDSLIPEIDSLLLENYFHLR